MWLSGMHSEIGVRDPLNGVGSKPRLVSLIEILTKLVMISIICQSTDNYVTIKNWKSEARFLIKYSI